MESLSLIRILTPNTESLGYALFLAINAAGVWGGVFPFLPMEFQTREIIFWFFLVQSLVFSASYALSCVGVYFFPSPTRRFLVKLASIPYFIGWCCLIAAIYIDNLALSLVCFGGAFLGLGSAGFYMLWQRIFASEDTDSGNRNLLVGTAWGAVLYYALYLIPHAVTAFLIPLVFLPLFGLCAVLGGRKINRDQPMFSDIPRQHPHVYRQVLLDHWRSALCVGAVGFCAGIMRSIAVADPSVGSLVNVLSMGGMLIAAIAVLWLWRLKNLSLSITETYKVMFPFLITSLLFLPLLNEEYARWLAAILYAVYSASILLMMMQCAQTSRDRGINPVFIYGYFGAIVYSLHSIGFIGGTFAEDIRVMGLAPLALVALVAVWALGIMHFIGWGGFSSAIRKYDTNDAIELTALRALPLPQDHPIESNQIRNEIQNENNTLVEGSNSVLLVQPINVFDAPDISSSTAKDAVPKAHHNPDLGSKAHDTAPTDRLVSQAQAIRDTYRLSARETEVMELIARGHSVARIADMLVVSENTVRTHSKRIYTKLDIHKKQELVDLIESFGSFE